MGTLRLVSDCETLALLCQRQSQHAEDANMCPSLLPGVARERSHKHGGGASAKGQILSRIADSLSRPLHHLRKHSVKLFFMLCFHAASSLMKPSGSMHMARLCKKI